MKAKATLSVERAIVGSGKKRTARRGLSLSQVVQATLERVSASERPLFADTWYGRFSHVKDPDAERMRYLRKRYDEDPR